MSITTRLKHNRFLQFTSVFVILILAYTAFAVLSCCMPDKAVKRHVKTASSSMAKYGNYPRSIFDLEGCQQDLFTEALILDQVYCIDRTKPFESAMKVTRKSETWNLPGDLWMLTHEDVTMNEYSYPRYWHGTTFLARFLLLFFNYAQIQWLLFGISTLLMLFFGIHYLLRAGLMKTVALLMSWALVYGFMLQFSLQFTPVFLITLVASILVIRFHDNNTSLSLLYFVTGSLTCYFDILTIPLLSFGWPLLVWLSLNDNKKLKMGDLWAIIKWALLWLAGFALTWVSKWALGSIVLGYNVFSDAFQAVSMRTDVSEEFGRWDAVTNNMRLIPWNLLFLTILGFVLCLFHRFRQPDWMRVGLFLLFALAPYVWYLALSNHSYLHSWFTYRLQMISIAALLLVVCSFQNNRRIRRF